MYEFPYGGEQQLNLNWIINEIITLHKRLDPDYELPNFDNAFPYMNLNQLNLDWILRELKAIKDLAPTEDAQLLKMVANALLAETYDAETQYNVDDIVYRDNEKRLFKCITTTPAGGEAFDSNKWVEVDVGGVLTDLLNSVVTPPEPYNSNPAMDGTASAGTSTQYARGDHVHPKDTARVPTSRTVNGKALSSNITLNASDIPNDSNVTGDNVDDALNSLNGALNSTQADIAPILPEFKANVNLVAGVMRIYNGQLYKTTQAVQNGDDLIIGTNVKITDVNTEFARGDARNITRYGNFQELADFSGTAQETISLTENAQHYTMILMQVFNSNDELIASSYMPTLYFHNLNVKLYGESSSQWGSFQLSNDYLSGTFNRTSATTSRVKIIGFFNTVN